MMRDACKLLWPVLVPLAGLLAVLVTWGAYLRVGG